jgi:predicted nucleotidyltransferase
MDTEKLLRLLNENKVKYVIIGATAFPVHGYARATLDLDIFIDKKQTNVRRVVKALTEFGYDMTDLTVDDLQSKKILIRQYIVETDIHPFVKGITFEEVWQNKVKSKIGSIEAYFASLEDLIKMKTAAARPKDLEDLKVLKKLKKKLNN